MPRGRKPKAKVDYGAGKRDPELTRSLAARIEAKAALQKDAGSDVGNLYKEAEDRKYHRKALKMAIRYRGMEPNKRNDELMMLQIYCEDLGVWQQGAIFPEPQIPQPPDSTDEGAAEQPAEQSQVGSYKFENGRSAAHQGQTLDSNPWAVGVKTHDTLEAGLLAGRQEVVDGLAEEPHEPAQGTNGSKRGRKHKATEAETVEESKPVTA